MPELRVRPSTDRARRAAATSTVMLVIAVGHLARTHETAGAQELCGTSLGTAPTLSVDRATLPAAATSTVTVTGTAYLTGRYPCGKQLFGGVYVFFGWVAPGGQWGPSHRSSTSSAGQFGVTYSYPGEGGGGETRDDGTGAVRLISFTSGGTSGSDTAFHMDAGGNWTTTVNVRGSLYRWTDVSTGATNTVDCRTVQCGILTVGAHGKSSATNERFTPISFSDGGPAPTIAPGGVTAAPTSGTAATPAGAAPAVRSTSPANPGARSSDPAGTGGSTTTMPPAAGSAGDGRTEGPDATPIPADGSPITSTGLDGEPDREIVAGRIVRIQDFSPTVRGPSPTLVVGLLVVVMLLAPAATTAWILHRRATTGKAG